MLLVIGAQPAIIGTAKLGAGLGVERPVAGLQVVVAELVVSGIGGDQRLLHAMGLAALEVIDVAVLDDDLGRHQRHAGAAHRGGLAVEDIGRDLADGGVHGVASFGLKRSAVQSGPMMAMTDRDQRQDAEEAERRKGEARQADDARRPQPGQRHDHAQRDFCWPRKPLRACSTALANSTVNRPASSMGSAMKTTSTARRGRTAPARPRS